MPGDIATEDTVLGVAIFKSQSQRKDMVLLAHIRERYSYKTSH